MVRKDCMRKQAIDSKDCEVWEIPKTILTSNMQAKPNQAHMENETLRARF